MLTFTIHLIVFLICLQGLRVLCYPLLPKFQKYITKEAFGLFYDIYILVDIAWLFNQQKKDNLYYTQIGIIICTFEEMGMELFVKNRSFSNETA